MNGPDKRMLEREALRNMIQQWNVNRLDLFELSEPNEDLSFHGVMRFYFQDSGQKVATKCIRVASDATANDVIETLIEKFRPDMRMLSVASYAVYELHSHEERKLAGDEKPLLVQLNWHIDDREGRFLLKDVAHKTSSVVSNVDANSNFKRKLSKREKKELKKKEKLSRMKSDITKDENYPVAEKLYTELPETSFTRSISNPEAVMRRRRQQKLERKLQQFRSKDGGPDTGGTLKIYGESLCSDVPYKTLLLSINDCAVGVVKEMMDKYGLGKVDPQTYCLVQVDGHDNSEYILDDDECPLAIVMTHPHRGSIMFHVRRRPADCHPRRRKKKSGSLRAGAGGPCAGMLMETQPDGSVLDNGRSVRLATDVVEVGSASGVTLQVYGPSIQPRHCVLAAIDGVVTLTPLHADAHTFINGQQIFHTSILQHGCLVKFGRTSTFRFVDPVQDSSLNRNLSQSHNFGSGSVYDRSPTSPLPDNMSGMMSQSIHSQLDGLQSSVETGGMNNTGVSELQRAMSPMSTNTMGNTMGSQENFPLSIYNGKNQRHSTDSMSGFNNNNNNTMKIDNESLILSNANSKGDFMPDNYFASHFNDMGNPQNSGSNKDDQSSASKNYSAEYKDNYETTFDLDGNVETKSVCSIKSGGSGNENRIPRGQEAILPAVLEFPEHTQQLFLHSVITELDVEAPAFKLAPVYTLYLCARYRASTHYRPELTPTERAHKLTALLQHVATLIQNTVQERNSDAGAEAFWMANGSELLHFLKSDRHISAFSTQAQNILAHTVQTAFSNLVRCFHVELSSVLAQWLDEPASEAAGALLLGALGAAMALLRRCRVNAALTIQLFSQLFHFINVWCFNKVVRTPQMWRAGWGALLRERLAPLSHWAERQGLELAADCHLATIHQCAHLLQAPKNSVDDMVSLSSACFKLNSVQLSCLLGGFTDDRGVRLQPELVQAAVQHAQGLADELHRADGREITLEESSTLPLSLLIPEDGFSAEVVRGLPGGLADFLSPLQRAGLCRLAPQPHSQGHWTVYMNGYQGGGMVASPPQQPLVQVIKLHKNSNGMGLSIVAAKGAGQSKLGIYIKSVVPGGAAAADQRLQAGDQLLSVDGHSLVGISQERAAEYLVRTGPVVTLEVAKQGAVLHGLATLLRQPSPNRGYLSRNPMLDKKLYSSTSDNSLNNIPFSGPLRHSVDSDDSVLSLHSMVDDPMRIMIPPNLRYPNIAKLYASGMRSRSEENHLRQDGSTENLCHREQCVDCATHAYSSDCTECTESTSETLEAASHYVTEENNPTHGYRKLCVDDAEEIPFIDETDSEPLIFEHKTCQRDNGCQTDCAPSVRLLFSDSTTSVHGPIGRNKCCNVENATTVEARGANFLYNLHDRQNNISINVPANTGCGEKYFSQRDSHNEYKINQCNRLQLNLDEVKNKFYAKENNFNANPGPSITTCTNIFISEVKDNDSLSPYLHVKSPTTVVGSLIKKDMKQELSTAQIVAAHKSSEEQFLYNPPTKTTDENMHKSDDLKLGFGKVRALVGHFDKICLTYQTSLKRQSQSSPNLFQDLLSEKSDNTRTAALLSQSLTNVPNGNNDDYFSLEPKNTLSQDEHRRHLQQLEDWSTYGTKQIDRPATEEPLSAISLEDQPKSAILYKDDYKKEHQLLDNKNILSKLDNNDQKLYITKGSPLSKKFLKLEKLIGLSEPRLVKKKSCKTLSTPNISKIIPNEDVVVKYKKFPDSYIIRKKTNTKKLNIESNGEKRAISKCKPNTYHIGKDNRLGIHRSCPNLMGDEIPRVTLSLRKNVRDRPPTPTHAHPLCTETQHATRKRQAQHITGPRRMSERDLPSTLEAEQSGQHNTVKSSKSVPALHEVFNPGYSRTSSSNSIPALAGLRGRINQPPHQHSDPNNFYQNLSTYKHTAPQDRALTLVKGSSAGDFQGPPQMKGTLRPQSAYLTSPGPLSTTQLHGGYPSMPNVNESYNANISAMSGDMSNKSWKGGQPASPRTQHIPHQNINPPGQMGRPQYAEDPNMSAPPLNHPMSPMKQQPPVAPKPQGMKRGVSGEMIPDNIMIDGPPLPPTATHPLYQSDEVGSYQASSNEPPSVSLYPHQGVAPPPTAQSNPWHREEREKELEARRLAARVWRDKQIGALQSLEQRSPQQEQQLRALTLERDFQRRAQEAQTEEDDKMHEQSSQDGFDDSQDNLPHQKQENVTNPAQDNKFSSSHMPLSPPVQPKSILKSNLRLDNLNSNSPQSPNKTQKNTSFVTKPTPQSLKFDNTAKYDQSGQKADNSKYDHNVNSKYDPKLLKYDANNIKYPEQMHKMMGKYEQDFSHNNLNSQNVPKFEPNTGNNNVAPINHLSQNMSNMNMSASDVYNREMEPIQRYDIQSHEEEMMGYSAPPPPERGSSFAVMSHQQALRSSVSVTSQLTETLAAGGAAQLVGTKDKRVSFHRPQSIEQSSSNMFSPGDSHGREDPDKFITEAENMLQSPTSPTGTVTHTPGVIGAQEFYRDPRTKRLAEQQKAQQAGSSPIPEKLSFKEKMKMFALESGESNTPKDKVKISRAQRDIDAVH